jgi:hypothetical protein
MPSFFAMTDLTVPTTALLSIGSAFLVVLIYRTERRRARAVRLACRRLLARADLHCSDPKPDDGGEPQESTLEEKV